MRFVGVFVLAIAVLLSSGCSDGVNQDELSKSQKEINASKRKGADSWQD